MHRRKADHVTHGWSPDAEEPPPSEALTSMCVTGHHLSQGIDGRNM
jgi:hypothetical protein